MNDFIKGLGRVCLGSIAGAGLGAASFFAIEALAPPQGSAQWLNEAGGNIYGDSRYNIDADPHTTSTPTPDTTLTQIPDTTSKLIPDTTLVRIPDIRSTVAVDGASNGS